MLKKIQFNCEKFQLSELKLLIRFSTSSSTWTNKQTEKKVIFPSVIWDSIIVSNFMQPKLTPKNY